VPVIRMCRSPRIAPPAPCSRLGRGRRSAESLDIARDGEPVEQLTTKPVATFMFRLTGVDIGPCPVCHAGRLRIVAVFRPGQIPVPRRARGRPPPWTPRESARRVPLAPRVSAPLCAAGRRRVAPRVSAGPPEARTPSPGPQSIPPPRWCPGTWWSQAPSLGPRIQIQSP